MMKYFESFILEVLADMATSLRVLASASTSHDASGAKKFEYTRYTTNKD